MLPIRPRFHKNRPFALAAIAVSVAAVAAIAAVALSPQALAQKRSGSLENLPTATFPTPADTGMSAERFARIDGVFQQYVDEGRLPGAVFGVVRNGRIAYISSVGEQRPDSIFRMYSMTKPVTIVAALMLYEEGRFLLSDPISRYLPEFANPVVYLGHDETSGEVKTRPAKEPITIEDLMLHTAGLTYGGPESGLPSLYREAGIWSATTLAEFSQKVGNLPLMFEPGTRWEYSIATDVLGRLVEVASGQPFDEFLQQRILQPLDMRDTAFHVPSDKADRFLDQFSKKDDGIEISDPAASSSYLQTGRVPYGGHGLVSTVQDYLRFTQMLINGGKLDGAQLLGRKTVELMTMNHLGPEFGPVPLNAPWVGKTENRLADPRLGFGFGYGGYVITDVATNAVPGSTGTYSWGGAASTYFFVDRKEQLAGVFLTQLRPSDAYPLRAQFRGLVYQAIVD